MSRMRLCTVTLLTAGTVLCGPGAASAQRRRPPPPPLPPWNIIMPQSRVIAWDDAAAVRVTGVDVEVTIVEQVATTTMDLSLENPSYRRLEAELIVPVPEGSVIRGLDFQGTAPEPTAQILPKEEAHRIYQSIVARIRDPALMEFVGYNLIRTSVFPVEPAGTQRMRVIYEHILDGDGDRRDYVLPRSESLDYTVPWNISVRIKSRTPISTVYSPSHEMETVESERNSIWVRTAERARTEPGPFRLSYLLGGDQVNATLMTYPDPGVGGGYFLLLAGLPAVVDQNTADEATKRDVTVVIDRSGSMAGEKLDQALSAALQIVEGLEDEEAFNLIVYNEYVDRFSAGPVIRSGRTLKAAREYLEQVRARGGTNIHDALLEALRSEPGEGMLSIVLFLTDGLPTVGKTSEVAIRRMATDANTHQKRIFTFGVGFDVNVPLLDRIASENRGTSTYVLPHEDVELKIAQVFRRLVGPVLTNPKLEVVDSDGRPAPGRTRDVIPAMIPDLFDGDQLVVLGQYMGDDPLRIRLAGDYLGKERTFAFAFPLDGATTRNAFVPRLWASGKIALLIDAIRQLGADAGTPYAHGVPPDDPRVRELVEAVVELSVEFGILTEYTAFLATEGTDLSEKEEMVAESGAVLHGRAMGVREGKKAYNQARNLDSMKQPTLNPRNEYLDQDLARVAVSAVQQINDRTFYRKSGRWVDSRLARQPQGSEPARVVEVGSDEFLTLVDRLAEENRQGCVSLSGEIVLEVDGESVLVR
jgi:Ca-activated chloride channel family protein